MMMQVTCQDVSTMIRNNHKAIVFLINNGGYTIEVEIHDGPYNVIKNWSYTGLVEAFTNGEGQVWTTKVSVAWMLSAFFSFLFAPIIPPYILGGL
jgi:pyruvate decarboxylase